MSESSWPRKLHVRSLNDLSRSHHLTYVGARLLAESLHTSHIEDWTNSYVVRKARTHRRQVYWKHSIFKGFDSEGGYDYRKCVIGSPTTHLTEVWLLDRLSREKAFDLPPHVYSYELSGQKSNHIYKYFYSGFLKRETGLMEAASRVNDSRVVIFDLRRFYPSVNVDRLRFRFDDLISRTALTSDERETAVQCVAELTNIKHEFGLPIGPPLSHALANVFLCKFDSVLSKKYPGRYFRYVDDVAIVSSPDEVESVKRFFEEAVSREELKINHGKYDVVEVDSWRSHVQRREASGGEEFGVLLSNLRRYLAHNPNEYDTLKSAFQSEGFTLPFSRLRSVATASRPFRKRLLRLFGFTNGENIPRPAALLRQAHDAKRHIEANLDQALDDRGFPSGGMPRRWDIQTARNLLNRSLYLLPQDRKAVILGRIPDLHELRPTRAVFEALVTGNASSLMKYPGPTVAAFCELWLESRKDLPKFDWTMNPMKEERDSVSVLALYGLCSPPEEWTKHLPEPNSRVMINLSARNLPTRRSFDDFSYIDEVESLFLNPGIDFDRILSTRFDDGEDVVLPALNLGGNHYMY